MNRRLLILTLCLLLALPPAAQAGSFSALPDRKTFCLAYERLSTAIARERPVSWSIQVEPRAMSGVAEENAEMVHAMLAPMELTGLVQCLEEGGYLEAVMRSGGKEIMAMGQMAQASHVGLNLGGQWVSIGRGEEETAMDALGLDALGKMLLTFDYGGIRAGDKPFVTPLYEQGLALWGLASPYSEDTNRLSVSSGATSHAVAYEMDTQAVRAILSAWAEGLSRDGLTIGIPGTALSVGISEAAFDAFAEKIRLLSDTVELANPIKLTTTFGEGDVLRVAKGSGTLQEENGRRDIAYRYSCDLSSTRITRKYSIDFQPRNGDTLVLKATLLTSSNNKKSGANEVHVTANGRYDDKPYKFTLKWEYVNKYAGQDDEALEEIITGKAACTLEYDGVQVFDIAVERNGLAHSRQGLTTAIAIRDAYDARLSLSGIPVFEGVITLCYDVPQGPQEPVGVLSQAQQFGEMDFLKLEVLRESMKDTLEDARVKLMAALPESMLGALADGYQGGK